jgi:cell division transport system permease protein
LTPWLGRDGLDSELPVPALIDASLIDTSAAAVADIERTVKSLAKGARVDRHSDWLGPLGGLLDSLRWLAVMLVVLTAAATAAAVILGARAALDQHRATIDVMHLMGATDRQISRLFERRVAQDAISGSALGFVVAILALVVLGWRIDAIDSGLVGGGTLRWLDWVLIAILPLAGVGLAIGAARLTVLRSLARIL